MTLGKKIPILILDIYSMKLTLQVLFFTILSLFFPHIVFAQEAEKSQYWAFQPTIKEESFSLTETLFSESLKSKDFGIALSLSFKTYSANDIAQANTQDTQIIEKETRVEENQTNEGTTLLEESPTTTPEVPNLNDGVENQETPLDSSSPPEGELGGQSLNEAANDPTASLMSLQIYDSYTTNFYKLDGSANTVVFRPVIPFKMGDTNHILRITAPIITSNPILNSGLSDLTIFDLVVFNESWGRWGLGPVALIPTGGAYRGAEKWAIGPAIGFTARKGRLLWGLFNQNLFSFAGNSDRKEVYVSTLQPILFYGLGDGWSISNSEMTIAYDWEAGRFSSLPLGIKVGKLVKIGTQPLQFSLQYEHDFANDEIGPANTVQFNLKILFPR